MMIASNEVGNQPLVSESITKDDLASSSLDAGPCTSSYLPDASSALQQDNVDKEMSGVDGTKSTATECEKILDGGCTYNQVSSNDEVKSADTAASAAEISSKQKRNIIRSLFDTVQRALKTDSRHVSSARFSEELAWTGVYGPLYRSLDKGCLLDIGILLDALLEKQQANIRCAMLSAVHQAILADVVNDSHAVAVALVKYSGKAFQDRNETANEPTSGDDQRKNPNDKDSSSGSKDIELWVMATGALMRKRILSQEDELSLWATCWKRLPNSHISPLLQELAICIENPQILRSICDFLLSTTDSVHIPIALQLLSLQLLKASDSLAPKAIIFQAVQQDIYFPECVHAWKQASGFSKPEFELFIEAVVLRQLRSRQNVEECLEYLADITQPPFLFANFDCDAYSSNLWETIIVELANMTFEKPDVADERPLPGEVNPNDAIPSTSVRGPVVTIVRKQPMNHKNTLAFNILVRSVSGISDLMEGSDHFLNNSFAFGGGQTKVINDHNLFSKRRRKVALEKVCHAFNTQNPEKGGFIEVAVGEGLIEVATDAANVAKMMREGRNFDQQKLGVYLSQGPEAAFPFQACLRNEYASLISFEGLPFCDALRRFLANFRLPGEAQCIDRLMETFSKELHRQQMGATVFKNSDAIYVLAFSTIMLNTDLHNPTIRSDLRMTKDQFIKNNRGINSGDDLPAEFLNDLYDNIKGQELHVFRGLNQFMQHPDDNFDIAWSDIVAQPREPILLLQVTDSKPHAVLRDMFQVLAVHSLPAFLGVFTKSWDDRIVHRSIETLEKIMRLSSLFEVNHIVNEVLEYLLPCGHGYALRCTILDPFAAADGMSVETTRGLSSNDSLQDDEETLTHDQGENYIPIGLLHSDNDVQTDDSTGCAEHRGLLALDRSFMFLKDNPESIEAVWSLVIDCLCALRDLKALPSGMSNLDDFADSEGNVLPLSSFAKLSQKRLEDHQKFAAGKGSSKPKGWFRFFRNKKGVDGLGNNEGDDLTPRQKIELSKQAKALLGVAVAADVEKIVHKMTLERPEEAVKTLLSTLDEYPFEDDSRGEQHAVFALELAARALLSSQARSAETYLPFLSQFESILCRITETDKESVPAPFVIERIVVTILRSCIHLYEFDQVSFCKCLKTSFLPCTKAPSTLTSFATASHHDVTEAFR